MISLRSLALEADVAEREFDLRILDQTLLPHQEKWLTIETTEQMIEAIKALRVRGAPLIGVAAALMIAKLAAASVDSIKIVKAARAIYEARPTAVNLMICVDRMVQEIKKTDNNHKLIIDLAIQIFNEDIKF